MVDLKYLPPGGSHESASRVHAQCRLTECHGPKSIDSCSFVVAGISNPTQSLDDTGIKLGVWIVKLQQRLSRQIVLCSSDYM